LTSSYNVGGLISVMALNGLFILITSHGLEYPDFYNKLYALLEPSIFVSKHRARFFEVAFLVASSCVRPNDGLIFLKHQLLIKHYSCIK
jgi:hypothetical protein